MWADLLNQASVMFSYVWGYNYMHNWKGCTGRCACWSCTLVWWFTKLVMVNSQQYQMITNVLSGMLHHMLLCSYSWWYVYMHEHTHTHTKHV
jgi:hypothetical protein